MDYKERTLKNIVLETSGNFKVLLITGMRQIGKTTFLKNLAPNNRKYITLDNPNDLILAKDDPKFFFDLYEPPVLIDEMQYAPELFLHIKILVDNSNERGLVWMTGSQQFHLMKNIVESLAGRVAIIDMLGFSIYERFDKASLQRPFLPSLKPSGILDKKSLMETYKIIWQGSYPDVIEKSHSQWRIFYDSYLRTYLERDTRQLIKLSDELQFVKFLKTIASRTAQELNLTDIARDVDISLNTAKAWTSILETSGIIYLLKPYYKNVGKRFIKRPKLYFLDTGLCSYLTQWNTPENLEAGAMNGAIFETFVVTEILKSYYHNGIHPSIYYYRDSNRIEIDLLIEENGKLYPIEIKKTSSPKRDDIKNFDLVAKKLNNIEYGSLICLTDVIRPLTDKSNAISIWDI
jgi:predicted AAA+ superfamily ATPase